MMQTLAGIQATLVQVRTKEQRGRRATVQLAPELGTEQCKAVRTFDLARWLPQLLSSIPQRAPTPGVERVA
jgi:hypothetical protein